MTKGNKYKSGIFSYKEEDLLTQAELLNFAMNIVKSQELDKNNYKIIAASDNIDYIPNFVCEKDDKLFFIVVRCAIAPDMPVLSIEEKKMALQNAEKHNAEPYFAPVGIGSSDTKRFGASIALRFDEYLINYQGLEKIQLKTTSEWIKNAIHEINLLDPEYSGSF